MEALCLSFIAWSEPYRMRVTFPQNMSSNMLTNKSKQNQTKNNCCCFLDRDCLFFPLKQWTSTRPPPKQGLWGGPGACHYWGWPGGCLLYVCVWSTPHYGHPRLFGGVQTPVDLCDNISWKLNIWCTGTLIDLERIQWELGGIYGLRVSVWWEKFIITDKTKGRRGGGKVSVLW